MTSGLVKDRKTVFISSYAVQWFLQLLSTKVMIYGIIPNNRYVCIAELTLPYIANDNEIEAVARQKIEELESYD